MLVSSRSVLVVNFASCRNSITIYVINFFLVVEAELSENFKKTNLVGNSELGKQI